MQQYAGVRVTGHNRVDPAQQGPHAPASPCRRSGPRSVHGHVAPAPAPSCRDWRNGMPKVPSPRDLRCSHACKWHGYGAVARPCSHRNAMHAVLARHSCVSARHVWSVRTTAAPAYPPLPDAPGRAGRKRCVTCCGTTNGWIAKSKVTEKIVSPAARIMPQAMHRLPMLRPPIYGHALHIRFVMSASTPGNVVPSSYRSRGVLIAWYCITNIYGIVSPSCRGLPVVLRSCFGEGGRSASVVDSAKSVVSSGPLWLVDALKWKQGGMQHG